MKKRIVILGIALLAFVATFAVCEAVTGNNWVGYVKVQLPPGGQYTMVGVNFEAIGGGGIPLNEFISTNSLTGNLFPDEADNVFIYDPAGPGYEQYYYDAGTFKSAVTFAPTNPVVHSGEGFWLKSSTTSTETNDIFLLGEVLLDGTNEKVIVTSYQQFGNPFATDLNLNSNDNWETSGATGNLFPDEADNVFIWNGSGYDQYYFGEDDKWHDAVTFAVADDAVISVGKGAWYKAQSTFTNIMERPYPVEE